MDSFLNQALNQATKNLSSVAPNHQELRIGAYSIIVKERIAEGGFGFIDLVYEANSRQEFVLKRCSIQSPESLQIVKKEISILQRYAGPNIVKILASDVITGRSSLTSREALLLLEYCPGGHLLERLNNRKGSILPTSNIYRIFGQIIMALKPFHGSNPPVIHRDLKLENILFGTDGNVRLCDFGSCIEGYIHLKNSNERATAEEIIGKETTQMYRAPEMVDLYMREVLTEKTDIWALGCILYALCFLCHPFQDAGSLGILNAKLNMPANPAVPNEAKILISRMLDMDPEARPSLDEIFDALSAAASGNPLPPYQLSEIAIQRKQERENASKRREQKTQKKSSNSNFIPARKEPISLASNSVAARRLAAKKGVDGNPLSQHVTNDALSSSSFVTTFADFDSSNNNSGELFQTSSNEFSADFGDFGETSHNTFDAFESQTPAQSHSSNFTPNFVDFESQPTTSTLTFHQPHAFPSNDLLGADLLDSSSSSIKPFDAFSSGHSEAHSFDPFPSAPTSAPSATAVFASFDFNNSSSSSASSSSFATDGFSGFDAFSKTDRSVQTEIISSVHLMPPHPPHTAAVAAVDLFDPFSSSGAPLQPEKAAVHTHAYPSSASSYGSSASDDLLSQPNIPTHPHASNNDVLKYFDHAANAQHDPFLTTLAVPSRSSFTMQTHGTRLTTDNNNSHPPPPVNPFLNNASRADAISSIMPISQQTGGMRGGSSSSYPQNRRISIVPGAAHYAQQQQGSGGALPDAFSGLGISR